MTPEVARLIERVKAERGWPVTFSAGSILPLIEAYEAEVALSDALAGAIQDCNRWNCELAWQRWDASRPGWYPRAG